MLKFECTAGCGKVIEVPYEHMGKKGKCPRCKAVVLVPVVEPQLDSLRLDAGVMKLSAAGDTAMAVVAESWPYPIRRVQYDERKLGNVLFDLPMQAADGSRFGAALALQGALPPSRRETALGVCAVNRVLMAGGVAALHRAKLGGLVFPISGMLEEEGSLTPVIALFIRAWARHGEELPFKEGGFDDKLGPGVTRLFDIFLEGMKATESERLPFMGVAQYGLASPLALSLRWCDFFCLHGTVFCVKPRISREDPGWDVLYAGGVREVVAMPMIDPWPSSPPGKA